MGVAARWGVRRIPAKPQEIAGREAAIAALDLSLPMAELYLGIKTGG